MPFKISSRILPPRKRCYRLTPPIVDFDLFFLTFLFFPQQPIVKISVAQVKDPFMKKNMMKFKDSVASRFSKLAKFGG